MGVVAEGFQDPLGSTTLVAYWLSWPKLLKKRRTRRRRECLCFAYGQLAEHCQPEIIGHSNAVIPVVFEFLNDQRAAVVGTACYVLTEVVLRKHGLGPVATVVRAAHV